MTYIYDILLNFNEKYYDFYDWNKNDNILHVKKIPIYNVKDNVLKNIVYDKVVLDKEFLVNIKDKTEVFSKREIEKIKYSCLLCGEEKIVGVLFNEYGNVVGKSDLLVDEYNDILESREKNNYIDINYILEEIKNNIDFNTRLEIERKKYIKKELNKLGNEELSYIYYERFLKENKNRKEILNVLINLPYDERLYKLIKMMSSRYKKIK